MKQVLEFEKPVVKIREEINEQSAASWYKHPSELIARVATKEQLDQDGIKLEPKKAAPEHQDHKH